MQRHWLDKERRLRPENRFGAEPAPGAEREETDLQGDPRDVLCPQEEKRQAFQWQQFTLGVCYYPEQWPEELWAEDLQRMKALGISVVRIAEFAWTVFEPEEGHYDFSLFDRFLELCAEAGMQVIFGTPTATPPAWLTEKYPEALNADIHGHLLRHGARRHYNYNSPEYRRLTAGIVTALAEHYGQHPAVIGWQLDNELNCETDEFYSEADHLAFRRFLQEKYQTLDALNEAWGTRFWSQTYTDWDQVFGPRPVVPGGENPHMLLDHSRFVSESCLSFAALQTDIIRKYCKPGDFVTTNGMFSNLDNHRLGQEILDLFTFDSYPDFAFARDRGAADERDMKDRRWSLRLTKVRSVCPHFGIMEQQSGPGGWTSCMEMPVPRPGQLRLWALQSVAHGADFISFFRWRTALFGTEIYWHGILDYDNRDNRRAAEVAALAKELEKIGALCGANFVSSFALVSDYDNEWDARHDVWHRRVAEHSEKEIFAFAQKNHVPFDVLDLRDETDIAALSRYPVLLYPHPMIMTERRAALLKEYVEGGGTLILGCRSGLKEVHGHVVMLPQPGLLRELTGTDVREFTFVHPDEETDPATPLFNDVLEVTGDAEVLARYRHSFYRGEPCLTVNRVGKGSVYHLGSAFSGEMLDKIFGHAGAQSPFDRLVSAPEEVELVMREKDGRRFVFALNYTDRDQTVFWKRPVKSLHKDAPMVGAQVLPPFGVEVVELRYERYNRLI
ncbi:MAG: beta-galactosidase [Lachnospiraceae bacterium]|nr:beta-galactosidase [Lachnospiraceae bacterium]